jgi:hypothetical protein
LGSGYFPFHKGAHGSAFSSHWAGGIGLTEDTAKLSVQGFDMFSLIGTGYFLFRISSPYLV